VQAFGTVGAIEAAYYRATGKAQLFSEQNLIDCNWTPKGVKPANQGCFGGYQDQAFHWIFHENGGLATEEDYPYASVNRFCNRDVKPVRFNVRCPLVGPSSPSRKACAEFCALL
jgi:Papain family cysteine protease